MLELLRLHPSRVSKLELEDEQTRTLRALVAQRRVLVDDKKRLANRLEALLKSYYPLVLELFPKGTVENDVEMTAFCKKFEGSTL